MGGKANKDNWINNVLQFLEEGVIDLVCLMTDLCMDRCDVIRETNSANMYSSCWEAAYLEMYGEEASTAGTADKLPSEVQLYPDCDTMGGDGGDGGDGGEIKQLMLFPGDDVVPGKANKDNWINNVLQFLEEGVIDLVCLMTDLCMDRCDVIRETNSANIYSSCWEAAYLEM